MRSIRLGDYTTKIGSGATPRGGVAVYQDHGTALIRSQNVLDTAMSHAGLARISDSAAAALSGVEVKQGDVLLNITGESVARCAIVDPELLPARVNQHVMIIRADKRLDSRFLQRVLVSPAMKSYLLSASDGGTRRALTKSQISDLRIPFPALVEQEAIAEVLGALDDKIAANAGLVEAATRLALASAETARDYEPLGNLVRVSRVGVNPQTLDSPEVAHHSLPAFDAGQMPSMEAPATIQSTKFAVLEPAVLVSKLNPRFPRIWDVPSPPPNAIASTEFVVLHPKTCSTSVLWALTSQPAFATALEEKASGTSGSHQRVRPDDLLATPVGNPAALDHTVHETITSLGLRILSSRAETQRLAGLRDALLPGLMSGRIRVKDAEGVVSEVV